MSMHVGALVTSIVLVLAAPTLAAQPASTASDIARATSAGPPSIRAEAGVMTVDAQGHMTTLRKGTNGWSCFPRDVGTPTESPLCFDRQGLAWYEAAMAGKDPDPNSVGLSYMLQGGSVWSNIHGDATKPEPGEKTYVSIPPHVMILSAKVAAASGYPAGQVSPDTSKPFVMQGGPLAIVIMPVK